MVNSSSNTNHLKQLEDEVEFVYGQSKNPRIIIILYYKSIKNGPQYVQYILF